MKRSRDDLFGSTQLKRPAISPPVEPSGQAQMSTASSMQRLTTNDALSYLKTVKENFQDKRDKYEEFLDVMKDFKAQRIDTSGVIYRVKELFKGNRDLILGFNTFLPKGYEITLPPEDELLKKKPVEFEEAISFVNKIKARFQGDDHVYKAFLDILNMYRRDNKSITEVYQEVSALFEQHADLLVEFTHFLPDTTGTASVQYPSPGRNPIRNGDDRGSPMATARPMHVEKYANQSSEQHVEKINEKREDTDKTEWEHADSLDQKRKSANRDESGADRFHRGDLESYFLEKVKERIQDPENWSKISDCIRSYKSKFVAAAQFKLLVTSLLGLHPDLMEACEDFIIYNEKNGSLRSKQVIGPLKADRDGIDHNRDRYRDRDNGERDMHDRGFVYNTREVQKLSPYASREKFTMKPIQELDLSNCENCTPSYRLLPENYPIPQASCRTEIGNKVLNDHWVSVTSGSEDYSFKHMRKNQYEESLFRCEDDRFELDMLLESVNTTARRVEEILNTLNAQTTRSESPFCIEDHLTALNLRCIERLYGDHGLDVMDVLRKNAPLSLPVVLTRLKQKQEEWTQCRADFNKVWAEIYVKNYHKSLDHRSFYFKQQDSRTLSAKALLSEIKEISEKSQNEDNMALSISAGYKQPIQPHLDFEYPDPDIQEDLYQLMKFSCREICTLEQHDKLMNIWTNFLEPMLGIPFRPPRAENKGVSKANNCVAKSLENNSNTNSNPSKKAASPKPSDMLKNGIADIPTKESTQVPVENGYFGVKNSPGADYIDGKSYIVCNTPHNGVMQIDANMIRTESLVSKPDGCLEKSNPSTTGEKSTTEENASAERGLESIKGDCGLQTVPKQESQDDINIKSIVSLVNVVPEGVGAQKCHKEIEAPSNIEEEEEEGELPPNQNLEEKMIEERSSIVIKRGTHCISVPSSRDLCMAAEETDANADHGLESAPGSSDTENGSETGDISAIESANGEECSPDEPDDDGDHDENNKAESEGEADVLSGIHNAEGAMLHSDHIIQSAKPLTVKFSMPLPDNEKGSQIFYGNDSFYLLFRLHRMLYERMQSAKLHSLSSENKWRILNNADDPYTRFKDELNNLLNGSSDNAKFEDECRAIIGAQSYVLFTLHKLIHKLVKQLQTIATEDLENKLLQLYMYEKSKKHDTFSDEVYLVNAHFLLPDDNLYRIECVPTPTRLTIQLMNNEPDKLEPTSVFMDPRFASYLNDELLAVLPEIKCKPEIYLKRNRWKLLAEEEKVGTCKYMEGLSIVNGIEIKVNSIMKAAFVLDTEDFLYRRQSRKRTHEGDDSVEALKEFYRSRRKKRCKLLSS